MPKHPNSPTHTMNRRPSDRRTLSHSACWVFLPKNVKERPSSERVSQSNNNRWNIFFFLCWLGCFATKEKSRDGVWKTRRSVKIKEFFSLSHLHYIHKTSIGLLMFYLYRNDEEMSEVSEWEREREITRIPVLQHTSDLGSHCLLWPSTSSSMWRTNGAGKKLTNSKRHDEAEESFELLPRSCSCCLNIIISLSQLWAAE